MDEPVIIVNKEEEEDQGSLGKIRKIIDSVWSVVDLLTPHRIKMKKIKAEFDNSSHSFFESYRFLNKMSMINLIAYLQLFYKQNFDSEPLDYSKVCDHTFHIPCFMYYSGFDQTLDMSFSLNLFIFYSFIFFGCINKWSDFDEQDLKTTVFSG